MVAVAAATNNTEQAARFFMAISLYVDKTARRSSAEWVSSTCAHLTKEFGGQMCAVQIAKAKVVPESQCLQRLQIANFF
jgi:hypothetical protein